MKINNQSGFKICQIACQTTTKEMLMDVYFIKQQKMSHFQINGNSSNHHQNGWKYLETIAGKTIYKKITEKFVFLTTWHYLILMSIRSIFVCCFSYPKPNFSSPKPFFWLRTERIFKTKFFFVLDQKIKTDTLNFRTF